MTVRSVSIWVSLFPLRSLAPRAKRLPTAFRTNNDPNAAS